MSLFAPSSAQRAIRTVLAFNQELAKIRDSVSESALGEIRLQWWQEVLEEIQAGNVRQQPVIQELAELKGQTALWNLLGQLIDARRLDMFESGAADMAALRDYAVKSGGVVQQAIYEACVSRDEDKNGYPCAVQAAGAAWSMLGLVRALPFQWQSGRTLLPSESDSAMQMRDSKAAAEALAPLIDQMLAFVREQLAIVSNEAAQVPPAARASLMCVPIARLHLSSLEKVGNNPFELPPVEAGDLRKILALFKAKFFGVK